MTSTTASPIPPNGGGTMGMGMGMDVSAHDDDDADAAAATLASTAAAATSSSSTAAATSSATAAVAVAADTQQQQQQLTPEEQQMHRRRATALQQADDVLEAMRVVGGGGSGSGSMQLDGLNLLGVVASPRRLPGLMTGGGGGGSGNGGGTTGTGTGTMASALSTMLSPSSGNTTASSSLSASAHATSAAVAANHVSSSNALVPGTSAASTGNTATASTSSSMLLMNTDYLSDTYHTIEMTLSHVTEQMDVWNQVLEDFSRQMMRDGDDHQYDGNYGGTMESQLSSDQLPLAMQDLELQSRLQQYLETCGPLAQNLQQRKLYRTGGGGGGGSGGTGTGTGTGADSDNGGDNDNGGSKSPFVAEEPPGMNMDEEIDHLDEEIPAIFWQDDFDLTDPDTFAQLLLLDPAAATALGLGLGHSSPASKTTATATENGGVNDPNDPNDNDQSKMAAPSESVQDWFPLVPPDAFGGYLDKVELALLQQVRSKSGTFFEESLRFAQLQEWIQNLLTDVTHTQETTDRLHQDLLQPMRTIPVCDAQRSELGRLLAVVDKADDMLHCKSSIVGYLSAQDDLTAIEQIQYGRRLLAGVVVVAAAAEEEETEASNGNDSVGVGVVETNADDEDEDKGDITVVNGAPVEDAEREPPVELHRLQALRTVSEQLNQYEQLVVTNLREELVEIFLGWNTAAVSSIYAVTGNGGGGSGGGGSTPTNKSTTASSQVQQRVCEIIGALQKCHGLATRKAYGNRLQDTIRMTVRTTVGEFASDSSGAESSSNGPLVSITAGATAMSLERFLDCLDMLFEQLLALLTSAAGVDEFCVAKDFSFRDKEAGEENGARGEGASPVTPMAAVVAAAVELSSKSISELLRIRKDAHSLVTLDEMKKIWDTCVAFTQQIETLSGHKAVALRSTLMAQAKAFVERKHESNMSALVAALDSERWTQCEVSAERQAALTRLCSGRAVLSSTLTRDNGVGNAEKRPDAEVEGIRYKTVWSCLLLLEMVMSNIAAAAHFQSLASNVISKISELLRLFNSRTTHLVLGAGAIHATARLKSINAKHLSLVTQCLGMTIATMPHVRAALMAQMPQRQHTLLSSLDQIKKELADHNEKVLNKFVTIIGGIVEHGLAPKIAGTNFDLRAKANPPVDGVVPCCVFLEGVSTNTRKMHQVLSSLLPPDHLQDVFSRIFAFVDQTVPSLLVSTAESASPAKVTPKKGASASPSNAGTKATIPSFSLPKTEEGKERLLIEVGIMTEKLNGLDGVQPWDFTAVNVLERKLEYRLETGTTETTTETGMATEPDEGEQNDASSSDDAPVSLPADGKETVVEEQEALFSVENESSIEGDQTDTVTLNVEPGTASTDGNETAVEEEETPVSIENEPYGEGEQTDSVTGDTADGNETAVEEQEAPISIENELSGEGKQTDSVTRDTADGNEAAVEEQEGPISIENEPPEEGEQTDSVTRDTADGNEIALDEQEAPACIENGLSGEGDQTDSGTTDAASGTAPADDNETVDEEQEALAPVENGPSGEGEETDVVTRDTADGEEIVDGEQETSASVENGSSGESQSSVPSEATHL